MEKEPNRLPAEAGAYPIDHVEDEAYLIDRAKAGDRELFLKLISPYLRTLTRTSYSILRNEADAEEVAQETVLKALAHLDQLRASQCFKSWLLQIAINEARMRLRKNHAYAYGSAEAYAAEPEEQDFKPRDFTDWRDSPAETLERKELCAAIHRALQSLDGVYREVFVLRDMQHLSMAHTAQILDISEANVGTRLRRARLQMREQLAPLFRRPRTIANWMPLRMVIDMTKRYINKTVSCKKVVEELSSYIDGQLDPRLRAMIEEHLRLCRRCTILVDSTRKLLYVVGDERVLLPPFESSNRLQQILSDRREAV